MSAYGVAVELRRRHTVDRTGGQKLGRGTERRMLTALLMIQVTLLAYSPLQAIEDNEAGWSIPRFVMTANDGRTVSDEDLRGQHLLVFFGYTNCPDVCPTGLQVISEAMDLLGPAASAVQPLFVTLDPERDTKPALASYVTHFHPRLIGLTGLSEMIERIAKGFRVRHEKVLQPGNDPSAYVIDHTAAIFHIGPDGRYLGRFPPGTSATDIAETVRAALVVSRASD